MAAVDMMEDIKKQMLGRREFNGLCAAVGLSPPTVTTTIAALSSASAFAAAPDAASDGAKRTVKFRDGTIVPVLGLGSGGLAQGRRPEAGEEEALRTGISLGMRLIDTAEVYGNGRSEKLIGRVIAGQRDDVSSQRTPGRSGASTAADNHHTVSIHAVNLKNRLGDVETNCRNRLHG